MSFRAFVPGFAALALTGVGFFGGCQGEPGSVRDVIKTAEFLSHEGRANELERFADDSIREFAPKRWRPHPNLPDPTMPLERLPTKFRALGGIFVGPPNIVLDSRRQAVVLQWGNGRHEIVVYQTPPAQPRVDAHTRKVSERVYVTAMGE